MWTTLVWLRQDLRLADNPALFHAAERGAVVPVYVWSPGEEGAWPPGGAQRWWLHQSLLSLAGALEARGSRLIVREGDTLEQLKKLAVDAGADAVYWNRRYEPAAAERDQEVKRGLGEVGVEGRSFNGRLLFEPWDIQTKQQRPYQVFTPFHRTMQALPEPSKPLDEKAISVLRPPGRWPQSRRVEGLGLMPQNKWYVGMAEAWEPGEAAAVKRLDRFLDEAAGGYLEGRDLPWQRGTSRMSPYLHHGEISPRQVYHAAMRRVRGRAGDTLKKNVYGYLREIAWREFAYHLLYHFPDTPEKPLREKYAAFPWIDPGKPGKAQLDRSPLEAWQKGQTGYPIVDAGMRQLWHTGWMHNRVRMITASFLVKHLLIDWREGARWFWDTLVDADLASNTLGWQWAGGCGADAAPYFRIFNPMLQGEKFDKQGTYVRKWCPELKDVPDPYIHKPWKCPPLQLQAAGVTLGENYPTPIVDHKQARERALAALSQVTGD